MFPLPYDFRLFRRDHHCGGYLVLRFQIEELYAYGTVAGGAIELVSMRMILPNWLGSAFRVQFAGDVGDRDSRKPLVPLCGVVACAGAVEAQKTNKAVQAEFALKN